MTALEQAYYYRDVELLKTLNLPSQVTDVWLKNWAGDFLGAAEAYKQIDYSHLDPHTASLVEADHALFRVIRGQGFPEKIEHQVHPLKAATVILYYAKFSWAFWVNHWLGWKALFRLLLLSPRSQCTGLLRMCLFMGGHFLAIGNHSWIGYWIARWMYRSLLYSISNGDRLAHFAKNVVLCSYPYTLVVTRHLDQEAERAVFNGEKYLDKDPYYDSLFHISALYAYAYTGDIARTEIYCEKLRQHHESGKLIRYRPVSLIMDKLPFALRGYGHLIEKDFFQILNSHKSEGIDPVINSQFYRVSSVIALCLGKNDLALDLIAKSRREREKTGSFKAWNVVDSRIEVLALRARPFDPSVESLLMVPLRTPAAPPLGALLVELIELLSQSLTKDENGFADQIMERICRHLQWNRIHVSEQASLENTTAPSIKIGKRYFTFVHLPENRISFVREIFSSLSPVIWMLNNARQEQQKANELEKSAALGRLAAQVAHDIRSPLAALDMATDNLPELQDDKRGLIRTAVSRIRDIANNLLEQHRVIHRLEKPEISKALGPPPTAEPPNTEFLAAHIESLVSEKKMQFAHLPAVRIDVVLQEGGHGLFARVHVEEFKRTLSNLINNSIEAFREGRGKVSIELRKHGQQEVALIIRDDGKGISKEVLPLLMRRGQTFGKQGGSGLGLYHAHTSILAWQGHISIQSEVGRGTSVTIRLPRAAAPSWYLQELSLQPNARLAILDDDESIHQLWMEQLAPLAVRTGIQLIHFRTAEDLIRWSPHLHRDEAVTYLIDHELRGSTLNGLPLIERLGIAKQSILVTARFEEPAVQIESIALGVRILPKSMIRHIPIVIAPVDAEPVPQALQG